MAAPGLSGSPPAAPLRLTPSQRRAVDSFGEWLARPARDEPFVLSGFAGTGKTFLSMLFLAEAEARGLCWTAVAPTHKAVGVLRGYLELAALRPTWHPSTLHRLLRLKLRRQGDVRSVRRPIRRPWPWSTSDWC